jgi:hypothetical protein
VLRKSTGTGTTSERGRSSDRTNLSSCLCRFLRVDNCLGVCANCAPISFFWNVLYAMRASPMVVCGVETAGSRRRSSTLRSRNHPTSEFPCIGGLAAGQVATCDRLKLSALKTGLLCSGQRHVCSAAGGKQSASVLKGRRYATACVSMDTGLGRPPKEPLLHSRD